MADTTIDDGDHERLVDRLFKAFSSQVTEMETRVCTDGNGIVEDAKILSVLAKTLETLVGVQRKIVCEESAVQLDFDLLRAELIERISAIGLGEIDEGEFNTVQQVG